MYASYKTNVSLFYLNTSGSKLAKKKKKDLSDV
jgi:hypothetical protein